jgi:dTDP-4-dehydrorhamnose 3,5-epimerase
VEIRPTRACDERGFFSEIWSQEAMSEAGLHLDFVQDNHSRSAKGVLRGLHWQSAPAAQAKLVRVSRGAVFDVAVDLRPGSVTYGQWEALVVSAELWNQLLVPEGFGHGFLALEDDTEVQYKVTAPHRRQLERSLRFDDPDVAIEWPAIGTSYLLSAKDRAAPLLAEMRP